MGQKKILIVDDDVSFIESNRDLLEAFGYDVYSAYDGQSGLEAAKKVAPDVMILDMMMATDTEGFEVARKVPDIPELQHTKILLITGVTHALHLPAPLQPNTTWLPVDRVLEKPIAPDRLIAELERVINSPDTYRTQS